MDGFDQVIGNYSRPGVHRARFAGDEGINVTFYRGRSPLELDDEQAAAFIAEGKPTFTECDFLRMEFPGDTKKVWDQPVTAANIKRFPAEWAAYKAGEALAGGTPIASWAMIGPGDVKKFQSVNIHTVEQLAHVTDDNLSGLGLGGREAREAARLHLIKLDADRPQQVSDELAELRAQVAALTAAQDKPKRARATLEQEAA